MTPDTKSHRHGWRESNYVIRMLFRDFDKPENFERDPYGELTNQMSHTLLGMLAAFVFLAIWREVQGEMPVRAWVFLCVFLPYAIGIEVMRQGWTPGDSWFDTLMYSFGVAGALMPYYERSVEGSITIIEYSHRTHLALLVPWAVLLFFRVKKRADAKRRQG